MNGSGQSCTLLEKGLEGYLTTEEGVAATAEMIVGEPFGSERQRKLAARYLAIDLALQTDTVDGEVKPRYSTQEIYNMLTDEYHVTIRDATDIVWRITRGTSLKREVVSIDVKRADGSIERRRIPEVYTKDAVYFVGQQRLFTWFKDSLPQHAKLSEHLTAQTDFSDISLLIIRKVLQQHGLTTEPSRASDRERLMNEGRQALVRLIDHLLVGKMSLEDMADPEWQELLRPGRVSYSRLFEPRRESEKL